MSTAIRCELCQTIDGVKPLATVRVWLRTQIGFMAPRYDQRYLCESCRREAEEHGDLVLGAKVEVL